MQTLLNFLIGCILACISFCIIISFEIDFKDIAINDTFNYSDLLKGARYSLFIAVAEELLFRYLPLRNYINLKKKFSLRKLTMIGVSTSLLFGILHLNFDQFPKLQILIFISAISLFLATIWSKSISTAIGMHWSWNLIQGVIFNFEGSGKSLKAMLLTEVDHTFLPEMSNLIILTTLFEIVILYLIYKIILNKKSIAS
ncbi:CPBP family intramembrane metalloprotease [Flammeovirga pectinis]|uniref:CPBP family intramembrane metalloprotease n=1 Tax=Flammeovirga pectinis TaxID=2494373 RepID=A0A3Q9FT72_9BACT|nr:CPBP family intramembrane glutamic endopeptidase [Flammeovirga pectinis]AZQ64074.1 CPBP family intramembrane metalloprotease [Flammeovirga pectinis]